MNSPRRPLRGIVGLGQAMLFVALQLADGSGAHGCPEHDAIGVPQAPAQAHAGHGQPSEHDSHSHSAGCTCVGTCHGTAVVGTPSRPAVLAYHLGLSRAPRLEAPAPQLHTSPRLLPFAIGPPGLS